MMNVAFKIPKVQLAPLFEWLSSVQLSGKESRERTRFNALLIEGIKELEKDRLELLEKYAEIDKETGEKKKAVDNGVEHFVIPDDLKADFTKEIADLYDEEFVIDSLEGNKSKMQTVRDIVLNTDYKFGPREGDTPEEKAKRVRESANYEVWCNAFEAVNFDGE